MTTKTLKNAIEAADHPILLTSAAQLSEAEKSWNGNETLGIDTEFVRERTYRARLGLVQISDGDRAWLVDPMALDDLEPLRRLLQNPEITKILHSSSEDLEVLYHSVGALPQPMFDTQLACAMLGQPLQMGYHNTVKWMFNIEVDKEQTRSNWCRRPLTDRQLHYAAMDVVLLPEMHQVLEERLRKSGRLEWLREDVARMQDNAHREVAPLSAYQRIGGAARLDAEGLRALRALAAWREETARSKDLARTFVVPDAGLLELARNRPTSAEHLKSLEGLHPMAVKRYARQWLEIVAKAANENDPISMPEPLDNGQKKQLAAMRKQVQEKSAQLGIDPALLGSRRVLERLLRAREDGGGIPERFLGWRKAVITDELL